MADRREAARERLDESVDRSLSAREILGNPDYLAVSYGGYRHETRDRVPTVSELKEDLLIMKAAGIRILRTYNTQQYAQAANLLEAIQQLRDLDPEFEMYVMLGAWIDCEGAWTDSVDHDAESLVNNAAEVAGAVRLAKAYPEIVKIIAVGNEAMVHWASSYYVRPSVILKWVCHLQALKDSGELPADLWITSSDNFASWGGEAIYQTDDLVALIEAVDYLSLHTYPFHDTHHNPEFWFAREREPGEPQLDQIQAAMNRAQAYAAQQYQRVADYIKRLGLDKPIHIGETGWATRSSGHYGAGGSCAADEFKQKLFYDGMRVWTEELGIGCFFFEFFDERWKDANEEAGSENHFGLIKLDGQVKYALWDLFDQQQFDGLVRGGNPLRKSFDGDQRLLMETVFSVPEGLSTEASLKVVNENRVLGQPVSEKRYLVFAEEKNFQKADDQTFPSATLRLSAWEDSCSIVNTYGRLVVSPGTGPWWGCGLEVYSDGIGEDLRRFRSGRLHFEIRGSFTKPFDIGFQTGVYTANTQASYAIRFNDKTPFNLSPEWLSHSVLISDMGEEIDLADVTTLLYLRGLDGNGEGQIELRNVSYSQGQELIGLAQ